MNVNRDVLDRLERLGITYYITGSWALAAYAEPRTTRDLDIVVNLDRDRYETIIRPAFEDVYLVNDPIEFDGRAMGGLIHRTEIARVDLIFGRRDAWARSAMDRRRPMDHPGLGGTWVIAPEDLILAKLEWSMGTPSELQLRDCRSIIRVEAGLDWEYLARYASVLGITDLLETVRDG
jgi:hypothetical protein